MAKFRKKPVVVDAEQWRDSFPTPNREGVCLQFNCGANTALPHIHTLEGVMFVRDGDWIIKGVNGEFYPCKPDIFEKTYEAF